MYIFQATVKTRTRVKFGTLVYHVIKRLFVVVFSLFITHVKSPLSASFTLFVVTDLSHVAGKKRGWPPRVLICIKEEVQNSA